MTIAGFTTTCPACKAVHTRPGSIHCETDGCRIVSFASGYDVKLKAVAALEKAGVFRPRAEEPCPKCGIRTAVGTGTALVCHASGCRVIEFIPGVAA